MSYVVLARKYRPQTFSEIYSQEHITQIMVNAIKTNRIAHAYLFTGPRGVGKTSMARILAKSLNCQNGPTETPCGVCHNCLEIAASTSTDVIEIDGASNTGVDDVRELQRELFYAPSQSLYKIYIIDEVHMLSKNAFNALLKTLEEPPENVIFIFATTEPHKVLATIISRCQRFDFRRIPVDGIKARLREIADLEKISIDDESLYLIARKSDGGMRDALSLLDQILSFAGGAIQISMVQEVFGELPLTMYANITQTIFDHDPIKLIQYYHDIINRGIDLIEFVNSYTEFLRNLIMLKLDIPINGLVQDDIETLNEMLESVNINNLMYIISILIQLKQDLRTSSHPSLLIEVVLIKLTRMEEMESLTEILAKLEGVNNISALHQTQNSETKTIKPAPVEEIVYQPNKPVEINYVSPKKAKELTKAYVLENWDEFLERLGTQKRTFSTFLKNNGKISNVTSDVIFMDINSPSAFKMISDAKDELNDFLSKYFEIPVRLIMHLSETKPQDIKNKPTLQDLQKSNPEIAKLIELTDSLIV